MKFRPGSHFNRLRSRWVSIEGSLAVESRLRLYRGDAASGSRASTMATREETENDF